MDTEAEARHALDSLRFAITHDGAVKALESLSEAAARGVLVVEGITLKPNPFDSKKTAISVEVVSA